MRKILSFVCVIMLLSLCACTPEYIKPVTENISFTAHISYYNEQYVAPVTISSDGTLTLEITEPDVLAGVKFIFTDDSATAEYNGITYTPDENNTQFFGVADKIYSVFERIRGQNAEEDDGLYKIDGEISGDDFEIIFGRTGIPLSLELDDNIFVRFSDAKILTDTAVSSAA